MIVSFHAHKNKCETFFNDIILLDVPSLAISDIANFIFWLIAGLNVQLEQNHRMRAYSKKSNNLNWLYREK